MAKLIIFAIAFFVLICFLFSNRFLIAAVNVFGDIEFEKECRVLASCVGASDIIEYVGQKCRIRKEKYSRDFHVLELRGAYKSCLMTKNRENVEGF